MFSNTIVFIVLITLVNKSVCGAVDRNKNDQDAIMFPGQDRIQLNSRSNFHDHHHHHHNHTHGPINRDDKILNSPIGIISEIPLSLIQELNNIENVTVLLDNYLEGEEKLVEDLGIASRFGSLERAAAKFPKPANCIPTLQTVELKVSRENEPGIFIYPSCTRVNRCGGCCQHTLLSCQPVEVEMLNFQVIVSQYTGEKKFNAKEKEIVTIEQHTKCKCDCIVKKEDCNSFQQYDKDNCRCVCTNLDEKAKCERFNDTKLWDPNFCKCRCREISDCTTGFYYDQNKCDCLQIPVRRRFADLYSSKERNFSDKEKYDIETPEVAPLVDEDDKSVV